MSIGVLLSRPAAWAQGKGGVLRIRMTAADIPYTGGQPDQGFEGFRFVGYQLYDPLVRWDLSQGEELPAIVPGLAESWEVRPEDPTKWLFKLRRGVKFHDGSEFNADAVQLCSIPGHLRDNQNMRPFGVYPGGAGNATNGSDHEHSIPHCLRRYLH